MDGGGTDKEKDTLLDSIELSLEGGGAGGEKRHELKDHAILHKW